MSSAALLLFGYLCGSIPFGVILTRLLRGVDVRSQGSGNIGATNVARVAGKRLGVLVLVLDAVKGAVPVIVARVSLPEELRLHAAVGLAAFLGHVLPVWLRFKGGKGVATALGVLVVLVPWAALAGVLTYAVVVASFRVSSVGSLAGGIATVGVAFLESNNHRIYAVLAAALFALMLYTHRANIARLLKRAENRF
jgi:glycerol-3-phosphate acyltransferase PlsY